MCKLYEYSIFLSKLFNSDSSVSNYEDTDLDIVSYFKDIDFDTISNYGDTDFDKVSNYGDIDLEIESYFETTDLELCDYDSKNYLYPRKKRKIMD